MPELPEVQITCQGITPYLVGNTIQKVIIREHRLRWPINIKLFQTKLKNQRVLAVSRRAKYIVVSMSSGTLFIHLGMSGSLRIVENHTPLKKHDHVDCILNTGIVLRFNDPRRFGAILFSENTTLPQLAHLGPEPLEKAFTASYLFQKAQKSRSQIKMMLMNQRTLVGIGNIYANECLFLAKVNPVKPASSLTITQCKQLHQAIQTVLHAAIKKGGTTLKDFRHSDGKPGYFSNELRIYNRQGKPCLECHSPIQLIQLKGRSTYFCPKCQEL